LDIHQNKSQFGPHLQHLMATIAEKNTHFAFSQTIAIQ